MAGMVILSSGSYVSVPTTKIKRQNKLRKLLSWSFIFLTTLYLSPCLWIYDVQITGFASQKKKKKSLPRFLSSAPDRSELLSPFQAAFFLKICPCRALLAQIREKMNFLQTLGCVS